MGLEAIAAETHPEYVDPELRGWLKKTRDDASGILTSITSFDFTTNFATIHTVLSCLQGVTQKLHGRGLDIVAAHSMVSCFLRRL